MCMRQAIVLVSGMVALFTAVFNVPIDHGFAYLDAPTADSVKLKQMESVATRAGRRMSGVCIYIMMCI